MDLVPVVLGFTIELSEQESVVVLSQNYDLYVAATRELTGETNWNNKAGLGSRREGRRRRDRGKIRMDHLVNSVKKNSGYFSFKVVHMFIQNTGI